MIEVKIEDIKRELVFKLKIASKRLKEAKEEYYRLGKENKPVAEGLTYAAVRYYEGEVSSYKYTLKLLGKGD